MRTLKREVLFLCVFDFNVKNEAIENVDFKFFSGGACPSLAGCKQQPLSECTPPPSVLKVMDPPLVYIQCT